MKTVYLHIGLHKTGTTSIQASCLSSPLLLKKYGRHYFNGIFQNGNHREVAYSILREDLEWPARNQFTMSREHCFKKTQESIVSNLNKTDFLIISAEAISYLRHQLEIDRLKHLFPNGAEVIPILFLRDKLEWIESYTRQFMDKARHLPSEKTDSVLNVSKNSWLLQHEEIENLFKRNFPKTKVFKYNSDVVRNFSNAIGLGESLPQLRLNSTKNSFATKKIFQIGFNKCGTTSLAQFFTKNGIRTAHYSQGRLAKRLYLNLTSGSPILSGLEKIIAFTDMEEPNENIFGHRFFKEMYAEYPDAYFILNTRKKINWIKSRFHHKSGSLVRIMKDKFNLSDEEIARYWSLEWDAHHAEVKHFFKNRGTLLLYDIESDQPEKICNFLRNDYHCDASLWGHHNATKFSSENAAVE